MADRYWVGGTGNWDGSTTTNWSGSSGGAGGASVPTSSDNVIFNSLSNATAYTVTITATANCLDYTMAGPLVGAVTWAGSSALNIYGSMNLSGGTSGITRTYSGTITFAATSSKTITSNSVLLGGHVIFNGASGAWQFQDTFNNGTNSKDLTVTNGSIDTNNQTITTRIFLADTGSDGLTLGSTILNCGSFTYGSSVVPSVGTSSIRITGGGSFDGNGKTYYELQLNGTAPSIVGANTFTNLIRTGTATKTDTLTLSANQTVTGTFTVTGNSAINRVLISSDTKGTARTITAAAISVDKADFQDITGAGAASWDMSAATGYTGDCGGNSMKALGSAAFTTATTTDCSAGTTWSTATWSSRVPLPQDTATFSGSGRTITQDMPRIGSVNFTGSSGLTFTPTLLFDPTSFYGSINLTDLGTLSSTSGNYTYEGRGSANMYCAGKTWAKTLLINSITGELIFQDNFANTSGVTLTSGILTANNVDVLASVISSSIGNSRTLNMGSGTWSLSGTSGSAWNISNYTSFVLNEQTSTIKFTGALTGNISFQGGGNTFNNFWNATTNAFACIIVGSNTFNDFKSNAGRTNKFTTGTTQHVTTFTANGTAGNEIVIDSTTTGTHALIKDGGGTITCDYLNIQHSVASPSATWLATNSTNNQGVATAGSGWFFGAFPVVTGNFLAFF